MSIVDRKYWLLGIAAGVAVGLLVMLFYVLIGDCEITYHACRITDYSHYLFVKIALHFVGPALFGAVFVYCLRSTVGTSWWRGLCLLLVIVAAHWGAFYLATGLYNFDRLVPPFTYGATFALVVAALVALLFPPARSARLVAGAVLASGFVALSYLPLRDILPQRGFFVSDTASWVTFGLVYAVVAAFLGWRLFEKNTGANA